MAHQEKENFISLISAIVISVPYLIYVYARVQAEDFSTAEELKYWATAILLMIPIRVVAQIVVFIAYSIGEGIANGGKLTSESTVTDERDKLIELKGDRTTTNMFVFGFMAAMLATALGGSVSTMFLILILSGFVSEVVGTMLKIYYYRRGL